MLGSGGESFVFKISYAMVLFYHLNFYNEKKLQKV